MEQSNAMYNATRAAKADFYPSIYNEGTLQYSLTGNDISLGGETVPLKRYAYSLSTNIAQPILTGGKIRNTYEAAKIKWQMAEENVQQVLDDIVRQAQTIYWNAAAKRDMYTTACQYVDIINRLTTVLQDKYEAGAIGKTDLLQMQTRLAEAQLQRSASLLAYRQAIQAMNTLMGRDPDTQTQPGDSLSDKTPMPIIIDLETALNMRSDYAIHRLQTEYQKRQMALALAEHKPTLSIGLQQQWGTPLINTSGKPKLSPIVFAKAHFPMFRWGKRAKSIATQRALLNETILAQNDKYDQIDLEVATSLAAVQENYKQITYANENNRLAQENLEINTLSYTEGRLTILDVLAAQLTWIQARNSLIQTQFNYRMAVADYFHATGTN